MGITRTAIEGRERDVIKLKRGRGKEAHSLSVRLVNNY
jgi:hypothetical protein